MNDCFMIGSYVFGLNSELFLHTVSVLLLETNKSRKAFRIMTLYLFRFALYIPYILDYFAPLFTLRPRIDGALCPSLIELYCMPSNKTAQHNVNGRYFTYCN